MAEARLLALPPGIRFGPLRWLAEVDSTNDEAAALAAAEPSAGPGWGVAVGADHQRRGRGRRGRRWESPPEASLLLSAAWTPPWPAAATPLATVALALAAAEATEEATGVAPGLKWPNDLVVPAGTGARPEEPAKLGGVLGEARGGVVVAGVGLNLAWPGPPPPGAVDVAGAGGEVVAATELAAAVLARLEALLRGSPSMVVEGARRRSATLGRAVRVRMASGAVHTGTACDLTDDGHLVVATPQGPVTVAAGEVLTLRS